MELRKAIDELQENVQEIKKQFRLKRLRRFLKLLLIGFLIGRDSDKKISELTTRNNTIIKSVSEYFEELENIEQHIKEIADIYTRLAHIEAKGRTFEKYLAHSSVLEMEKELRKHREMILIYIKRAIEQREYAISKQLEEIVNGDTYLTYIDKKRCVDAIESFEEDLSYCDVNEVLEREFIYAKMKELEEHLQTISDYNKEFIEQRRKEYNYLWNKGLLSLDEEQQVAIITDDKHNLVVAAAGSGKTEVLITRIAYLIARKPDGVQPKRILAIAYQRKAKEEIEQRLHDRYNIEGVNVRTFHKLGKDIIEKTGREIRRTDIVDENKKHETIKRIFEHKIDSEPAFYELFLQYVKTLHDKEKEEELRTKEETLIYTRERSYFSIDNTRVNSRAEKEIMDFFLTNKLNRETVAIKYEPDVDDFRPDFHLPRYDLFIEHWALDEKEKVPEWFSQSTAEYKKSMEMKKKWFAEHDKLLVETFAYEYDEDNPHEFIELLKKRVTEKLQERHIGDFEFTPKTYDEVIEIAWGPYKNPIDDIVNFITSAKTYGLTPARIIDKLRSMRWTRKQLAFGNLAVQVFTVYEEELRKHGKIDFEDMINNAINELNNDKDLYADDYDHILIDEYQDISAQRYRLIRKLLERNPKCKLFCVGDDWQSIMAFSGSNLNFFVNFDKYFENPAMTKISTNYRSVKSIVDAGADLIKNNTSCQIQKPTLSNRKEMKPIKVLRSPHKKQYERNYHHQTAEDCLARIAEYLQRGCAARDMLVLTRYMRTRVARRYRFLPIVKSFMEKAKENGIRIACDNAEARNRIRLLTVHKSKGLEAKVVFILNVIKDIYGFPCEIEDPSIYELARENYPPQDRKEEERRLFYVAMTRAKEDLYIYTWEPAESEFLDEIEEHTSEICLRY